MDNNLKLYSQKAISVSTFIGGPLAAGILIRRNFINLGKDQQGKNALYIGIISTIILFGSMFFVPENIMEKMPNMIIPAIYTGIIYFLVDKLQGVELKDHEANEGSFYSGWNSAKVGLLSLVAILAVLFSGAFLSEDLSNFTFDSFAYEKRMTTFTKNETVSMEVFQGFDDKTVEVLIIELNESIKLWQENIVIMNKIDSELDLSEVTIMQNKMFLEYSNLRIKHFSLILKAIEENTDIYNDKVETLVQKINDKVTLINELQ